MRGEKAPVAVRSDDEKVWLQEPFRLEDHVEHVTADRVEPVRHAVRACDLGRLLECVVVLDGEVLRGRAGRRRRSDASESRSSAPRRRR